MDGIFVGKIGYDTHNKCYVSLVAKIATVGETDGGYYWIAEKLDEPDYYVVNAGELIYKGEEI